jgi:hypothetical protein
MKNLELGVRTESRSMPPGKGESNRAVKESLNSEPGKSWQVFFALFAALVCELCG